MNLFYVQSSVPYHSWMHPRSSHFQQELTFTSSAPTPPQIERHEDVENSSTVDVDSVHVHSVPSTYSGETDTQMNRLEHEAEDAEREAKARFEKFEKSTSKEYTKGKSAAARKGKQAQNAFNQNKDNPVVIGNAVIWTVVAATLG